MPFIGIPLNQYPYNAQLKSKALVNELENFAHEDLTFKRHMEDPALFKEEASPDVLFLLENIEKFMNNEQGFEKYQIFLTEYELDFEVRYNGGNENPAILGFYIEKLCPLPDTEVMKINVNMTEINRLAELFEELAEKLFSETAFKQLKDDNLIGAFYNIHSS
jgi:hypothetical protein